MNTQTLVLVRVRCADGIQGWGEATTIGGLNYGEESPESIKVEHRHPYRPAAVGMDASQPAKAMAKVRKIIQGNRFAKCALETALLDAQASASACRCPNCWAAACATRCRWPGPWPAATRPRTSRKRSTCWRSRRHRIFKLKIGLRSVDDDVAHVLAIKRALGDRASVRVDVNQAWSEWMPCAASQSWKPAAST
jgi:muconate cycloisomerase